MSKISQNNKNNIFSLEAMQADIEELMLKNQHLLSQNQELHSRYNRLSMQHDTFTNEYQKVINSTAWRIGLRISSMFSKLEWLRKLWFRWKELKSKRSQSIYLEILESSSLFNEEYYINSNEDIKEIGITPLEHYYLYGGSEGRDPSIDFSSSYYLFHNPDVVSSGLNPLIHYLEFGKGEGRHTHKAGWSSYTSIFTKKTQSISSYDAWLEINRFTSSRKELLNSALDKANGLVSFSLVMPVYNPPMIYFKKAIESVLVQEYDKWELCIADDCSTDPDVKSYLELLSTQDKRIKVHYRVENGHISRASNSAAEMASNDFIVFLDQDDELEPDALAEMALFINDNPDTDILYTDDDKIDCDGAQFAPQFKPDWSPELLLSYMYFSHLFALKRTLFNEIGGFRHEMIGSQDYDLALRATSLTSNVGHIPRILYHWRVLPGSTASSGNEKHYSFNSGINSVQSFLDDSKINGTVKRPYWAVNGGLGLYSIEFPDVGPSVGIIIPTKNMHSMIKRCIESLKKTTYKNYKIYVVDTGSDDSETIKYLNRIPHEVYEIICQNDKFSFSYVNNKAVEKIETEYLLFLNNDTEVKEPRWLSQMVGYASIEGVGAVGAKLLYKDESIQHAGVMHGINQGILPDHTFKNMQQNAGGGYLSYALVTRNCSSVTAACMLTPRALFNELNGFDELNFAVAFNDVDYCYRLQELNQRIVYCAEAELYHYEGKTRGTGIGNDNPAEEANYVTKYGTFVDKYLNPNLFGNHFEIGNRSISSLSTHDKKIMMVTHNLNYEGASIVMLEIAIGIKKLGNMTPIIISPCEGPLCKEYEENNIQVNVLEEFSLLLSHDEIEYHNRLQTLLTVIKRFSPDIIYANTVLSWWSIDAGEQLGIPSIWHIHESEEPFSHFDFNSPVIKDRARICLEFPYQVVFVARSTFDLFKPLCSHNNFSVIHNGFDESLISNKLNGATRVDIRNELSIEDEDIVFLLPGTVCERKGQIDLLDAVRNIDKNLIEKIKVFIVGDESSIYSDKLHLVQNQLPTHIKNRIKIIPKTSNIGKYYLIADVFVCTSRIESYPRVIQEAMFFSLPIISTPVFGISEQVVDEVSALFYMPGNTDSLSEQIKRLITSSDLRHEIGTNAKITLGRHLKSTQMIEKYNRLFQEAYLSGKPRLQIS